MPADSPWSLPTKILFRFFCVYWPLYILPLPGERTIVPWLATHLFHVTGQAATYFPTGSGDTTLAYIGALLVLTVSIFATLLWSILDSRRPHYRSLNVWLRLLVRYFLASTLFAYGVAKLLPTQFPPLRFSRLMQPFGDFSPMGVLWSFMSTSQPYTVFTGATEAACALLLIFRRTATLGALLSIAVLANVVALNYCYDVPVKLSSSHLLLMALFLLTPDWQRLANVLLLNRPASPADLTAPAFPHRWQRLAARSVWAILVVYTVGSNLWEANQRYASLSPRYPLFGLYRVESGAPANWLRVSIDGNNRVTVRTPEATPTVYQASYNHAASKLDLNPKAGLATYNWRFITPTDLILEGTFSGAPSTIRLHKIDGEILLPNRGFHWISEQPFNR